MLLSEKLLVSIEAVVFIAFNSEQKHRSREVESSLGLPARYLEPVFQRLVRHQILESSRGPGGGYSLGREPSEISIKDVIKALEEDGQLRMQYTPAHPLGVQVVKPARYRWNDEMVELMQDRTIAELCQDAADQKIAKHSDSSVADYTI